MAKYPTKYPALQYQARNYKGDDLKQYISRRIFEDYITDRPLQKKYKEILDNAEKNDIVCVELWQRLVNFKKNYPDWCENHSDDRRPFSNWNALNVDEVPSKEDIVARFKRFSDGYVNMLLNTHGKMDWLDASPILDKKTMWHGGATFFEDWLSSEWDPYGIFMPERYGEYDNEGKPLWVCPIDSTFDFYDPTKQWRWTEDGWTTLNILQEASFPVNKVTSEISFLFNSPNGLFFKMMTVAILLGLLKACTFG